MLLCFADNNIPKTKVSSPREGEDQDRRFEDVELTALPVEGSQVERRERRALGRDYGCNWEKIVTRTSLKLISFTF